MRILLTSILCKSGLSTHVWDLTNSLIEQGVTVSIGFRTNGTGSCKYGRWLEQMDHLPYFFYTTNEELLHRSAQLHPHLIHTHSPLCFPSSVQAAVKYGVPLIITLHSPFPVERWYPLTVLLARWIIAVGPAQKQSVPSYLSKTVIIPNGIDLNRFQPKTYIHNQPLKICWFGRAHGAVTQGISCLNQALRLVRKTGAKVPAYFIGVAAGAERDEFIHIGWLDDPVSFLQKTQAAFGHGRALREAMACGNIGHLLGAGYGGLVTKEMIESNQHLDAFPQYRLAPAVPERLADHILKLLRHPDSIPVLQKEARQIALKYFDRTVMTESILSLYSQAISDS